VDAVRLDGFERRELLERRLPKPLVLRDRALLARRLAVRAERRRLDRDDLARVAPLLPRDDRLLLALEPEAVGVQARDAELLRDHLGALELGCERVVRAVRRGARARRGQRG